MKYICRYQGYKTCQRCWYTLNCIARSTFYGWKKTWQSTGGNMWVVHVDLEIPHLIYCLLYACRVSFPAIRPERESPKKQAAMAWFTDFIELVGDHRPDKSNQIVSIIDVYVILWFIKYACNLAWSKYHIHPLFLRHFHTISITSCPLNSTSIHRYSYIHK